MQVGGDVHVLVAGANAAAVATAAAAVAGVSKVLHADSPALAEGLAENVAAQVLAVASGYSHIFFPATASGKNVAPRVAAKLDVGQLSDISKVLSADTFERPDLRRQRHRHGAVLAGRSRSPPCAPPASIRPPPPVARLRWKLLATPSPIRARAAFVGKEIAKLDRPELTAAKIIVSGGRAMGSSEKFNDVLTPLADKLGAALGASRAAVDAGYAPNDWQVGQTGKIVAPQLYIACGISGAIQHLAGMKDSKVIVAINKDEEAPIFSVADYGLVADLFVAVPEMIKAL